MIELIRIAFALFPVFVFLILLIFLDSYKLVKFRAVLQTVIMGCLVALLCYFMNSWVRNFINIETEYFNIFVSPVIEELFKAGFIIFLIRSGRIGFMVDGAILGFAIGTGFALIENIFYLRFLENAGLFVWVIRGFGTAIMHGGTTAIFAIISKSLFERNPSEKLIQLFPGLLLAIIIHGLFNIFSFEPVATTIVILFGLPFLIIFVYNKSEDRLREWLEVGFDADAFILDMINSGNIENTKLGRFLLSLKSNSREKKL